MGASPHLRGRTTTGTTASGRVRAVAVLAAAVTGFGGAAAVDALAEPGLPVALTAADFGAAGDGLTRLVVSAVSAEQLAALQATPRVVSAQQLFDGSALVATEGLAPADLAAVVPGAEVIVSEPATVAAATIDDPYWSTYGYNLLNTGSNSRTKPAVAGADVAAPTGWQAGTGRGMVVAVVDSGMMIDHPDLQGSLWTNPDEACGSVDTDGNGLAGDCHGWNFYAHNADVTNGGDNQHGTSVAGAVGARLGNGTGTAGVAPDVTIMPLVAGAGSSVDVYAGAQAIRYAADHGADVVNASWGGNGGVQILTDAIRYANTKGVVVVVAAGNDANDRDAVPVYPASLDLENMVTVGASTPSDTVAGFSAYGARTVDLFAPGDYVLAPLNNGDYFLTSGTSIASPQVAAAFALYRAQHPDATPAELKALLFADTQPVPAFAGRSVTGGRLSLTALGNTAAEVRYTFTGMTAEPGVVDPQVTVSGDAPAGEYSVTLGLGMENAGEVMALADQEVSLDGTTVRTGDDGQATFPLGARPTLGTLVLSPTAELSAGRYVLMAQVRRDGEPVGRPYAAPLLVGAQAVTPAPGSPTPTAAPTGSPAPGTTAPTTTSPATSAPGTTAPATSAPTTPAPGAQPTSAAPTSAAPTSAAPTSAAPTSAAPTSAAATSAAPTSAAPTSAVATPTTTPEPGTTAPVPTAPVTTAPETTAPQTSAPASSAPATPTSAAPTSSAAPQPTTAPPTGGTEPDAGGTKTYPEVGPFKLTSISPTRVDAAGGTRVTITGGAVPAGARVRVGLNTAATVSSVTGTRVVFTTPQLVAGVYDVYVFAPDGTSSVLEEGLTYVSSTPAPTTTPVPTSPSTPTAQPTASVPSTTPAPPGPVVGPNGQRLVRSALFATLAPAVWKVNCSSACSGIAV